MKCWFLKKKVWSWEDSTKSCKKNKKQNEKTKKKTKHTTVWFGWGLNFDRIIETPFFPVSFCCSCAGVPGIIVLMHDAVSAKL